MWGWVKRDHGMCEKLEEPWRWVLACVVSYRFPDSSTHSHLKESSRWTAAHVLRSAHALLILMLLYPRTDCVYCSLPVSFQPTAAIPNHYHLLTLALPDLFTCRMFLLVVYLRLLCRRILFLTAREALSCFVSSAPSPLSHFWSPQSNLKSVLFAAPRKVPGTQFYLEAVLQVTVSAASLQFMLLDKR